MTEPALQTPLKILVVDDEPNIRKTLVIGLESQGCKVVAVSNPQDAITEASQQSFDLAFVDVRLGAASGLDLVPRLVSQSPWMQVIVVTAFGSIDTAVEAMKRGAKDFLTKPFTPSQLKLVTQRVAHIRALEQQVAGLQSSLNADGSSAASLESKSPAMQRVASLARQVAQSDATVLIRGESGTGKGVVAQAIHDWSARAGKPFATVACPSLSASLLESELFGHARGAFTGAVRDNPGRIASSEGGTVFLDEIGDLPPELQPKMLRFIQERKYERVGDATTRRADVRIIAATNVDLEAAVKSGKFRQDLFYRINVVQLVVPPLRERVDDIQPLAEQFLASLCRGRKAVTFTDAAVDALRQYSWPGNVRELRNVVERAVILCQADQIGVELLPESVAAPESRAELGDAITLDKLEELHIRRVLAKTRSLDEAASVLGIDLATLWRRRKKYGI
jgi:two-component system, NtrC family, response regulator AlgB